MATSLSQQLQRLAVPQTAALIDSKKKASILFDPLEAAKKDRRTIYELGVNGLHELIVINPEFQQFEETLFNEQTLHMERSVETSEVNSLLDKNIKKFMQHLSPYLLLRPCHMCLEWLLRRFQVNAYNRKELLALALPYHETNIFVRILQTMKLKDNDMQWGWMRPLQKPGVTLPKTVILNRAASDATFLKFVCESTMAAIAELGSRASTLQAQLNFYASVVVGALENSAKIQEWHVVTILPSLLKGLSSNVIDFASAAYIVAAQLVASTTLTNKLCTALISRVAAVSIERLRPTAVLLLIWIYDSQKQYDVPLSNEILSKMVTAKWLTEILSNLSNENTAIHALCIPLITAATKAIHDGGSTEETAVFKQFMQRLLQDIKFSNSTAALIIK